jgi:hypothetical protein
VVRSWPVGRLPLELENRPHNVYPCVDFMTASHSHVTLKQWNTSHLVVVLIADFVVSFTGKASSLGH